MGGQCMGQSYYHMGSSSPLLGATIPQHFASIARRFPFREAFVSRHQQRRMTYRQLEESVDRLARGLLGLGFVRGERIGIWATNQAEWLLLQLAAARIGVALVAINPGYRRQELAHALDRSELHGLFTIPVFRSSDYLAMLQELIPELEGDCRQLTCEAFPLLRRVVLFDPIDAENTFRPLRGLTVWQEVLQAAESITQEQLEASTADLDRDDAIALLYTSGSRGFPKTAVLSHHNLLNNAWFSAQRMHFSEHDRLCTPVPFYHCFGMVLANLLSLSVGACIVLPGEYFDPLAALQTVQEESCTAIYGVPTMFVAELEHSRFNEFDLTSLRTGIMGGAPCPPELVRRVMAQMHCPEILIGYGMTEASPITHLTAVEDPLSVRVETVGRNLPHQEVKIIDPDSGRTQPVGEVGEICFRGYHIAKGGYYGEPKATAEAIDSDRWLHSGDLGAMDENGYVRITGRRKEIIIRGGENISPWQIEQRLLAHPAVAEVAVFGVPDEFYGEEIMAWVRLKEGGSSSEDELRTWCKTGLAHFKVPRYIRLVECFPMTGSGKLQKVRMREEALTLLRRESSETKN
ncbi:AMP-binding protein [Syntrophotalea acetylenivorans]|uniref:AMP-binding protein n=1 Tax=Syntrophotalea acetylenivorans TaxID=1842532 RepID=A0A1L3GMT9_9BACT|nr:fatty acid CoA ligase family protein [Syntrophotalea acetylenivorans]APG27253.1 AMP-binding protein [Syntrophotalea acetylenivorans]